MSKVMPLSDEGPADDVNEGPADAPSDSGSEDVSDAEDPEWVLPHWLRFSRVVRKKWFEYMIMGCIGVSCLQLALYDPYDTDPSSVWNRVNSAIDYAALAVFTTEMVLKHVAYGPAAYWSVGWNRLDGLVVTTGYLSLIPGMDSLVLMKLLRVLRPLRIVNKLAGMKRLMTTLVGSAKPLADTGMLCMALLFIFGIVGLTLFAGYTRQQCYTPRGGNNSEIRYDINTFEFTVGNNTFEEERYCGGKFSCPTGDVCLYSSGAPNFSLTSFDHISVAFLTIFTAVTLEGWTDVMYILQDSFGYWSSTIFFHVVVIFGSLFALNLALAVLADSFSANDSESESNAANVEEEDPLEEDNIDEGSLFRRMKSMQVIMDTHARTLKPTSKEEDQYTKVETSRERKMSLPPTLPAHLSSERKMSLPPTLPAHLGGSPTSPTSPENATSNVADKRTQGLDERSKIVEKIKFHGLEPPQNQLRRFFFDVSETTWFGTAVVCMIILNTVTLCLDHKQTEEYCRFVLRPGFRGRPVVQEHCVDRAAEMDNTLVSVLAGTNYYFTGIFTIEAAIKFIGYGPKQYFKDPFNTFDFVIVLVSYVEIAISVASGGAGGGGIFSVLRTFRLMRILKLVKNWDSMRVVLQTIQDSLSSMIYLIALAALFMFMAAVAGMQLFGAKMVSPALPERPRANFDNFGVAMLTVFQVITIEDWNQVMYNAVEASGPAAAIYFIVVIMLGTFIVLNLTIAILLSNFGASYVDSAGETAKDADDNTPDSNKPQVETEKSDENKVETEKSDENKADAESDENKAVAESDYQPSGANTADYLEEIEAELEMLAIDDDVTQQQQGDYLEELISGDPELCDDPDLSMPGLVQLNPATKAQMGTGLSNSNSGAGAGLSNSNSGAGAGSGADGADVLQLPTHFERHTNMQSASRVSSAGSIEGSGSGAGIGGDYEVSRPNSTKKELFVNDPKAGEQIVSGQNNAVPGFYDAPVDVLVDVESLDAELLLNSTASGVLDLTNNHVRKSIRNSISNPGQAKRRNSIGNNNPPLSVHNEDLAVKVQGLQRTLIRERYFCIMKSNWQVATSTNTGEYVLTDSITEGLRDQLGKDKAEQEVLDARRDCTGCTVPEPEVLTGKSFYLLEPESSIRVTLSKIVQHPIFDNTILVLIMASSITLAMDGPTLDPDSDLATALVVLDIIFTVVFVCEMLMKMIVMGFLLDPNAYLRDAWNVLDFVIVLVSLLSTTGLLDAVSSLRALRTLRALRPLRTIKRAPGLKCVVETIICCLPPFFNIALVSTMCYLVFAIMGVQFWGGKFWKCTLPDFNKTISDDGWPWVDDTNGIANVTNVTQCIEANGKWQNAPLNFDNCAAGMLTLYEVASLELWVDVMHNAMDAPSELGEQPSYNRQWWSALYFVIFIVCGSFLIMNLFVGAVVDTFNVVKAKQERSGLLSESQAQFVASMRELFNNTPDPQPVPPEGEHCVKLRTKCFEIVTFSRCGGKFTFDNIVAGLIGANILVMAMTWWELPNLGIKVESEQSREAQESTWNLALEWINFIFTWIFAFEATLKLVGLGPTQYWSSGMNRFDLVVVLVSVLGVVITLAMPNPNSGLIGVLMVFRVARSLRIFRLAVRFAGIKRLMQTLLFTLPSVMNVMMLLVLVMFIYAVLGMSFFGDNPYVSTSDHSHYGAYNEHANFRHFHIAFFTLFRMSTGEQWNAIMHDVMDHSGFACSLFFVSYQVIASSLLLNLVIAIMLDEFSSKSRFDKFKITPADLENFTQVWSKMDPAATLTIKVGEFPALLTQLGTPLGVECAEDAKLVSVQMGVAMGKGGLHFTEVFTACARRALKVDTLDKEILADIMTSLHQNHPELCPGVE